MKRTHILALLSLTAVLLVACQALPPVGSPTSSQAAQPSATANMPFEATPASTADLRPGGQMPAAVGPSPAPASKPHGDIPIESVASVTLSLEGTPDFLEISHGSVWVTNRMLHTVQRIDAATNKVVAEVQAWPCSGVAAGFQSIWAYSCADVALNRIDEKTNNVIASIKVHLAGTEGSIGAGEGGVWILTDGKGVLSRIDPETNTVVAEIPVKPASYAAATGYGAVWVTNTEGNSVQRVDPKTNTVVATIPVGDTPRFLAVGEDGVWTLNQGDGTVSRIDPGTNRVLATIDAGVKGPGGDIAAGEGSVWVRGAFVLLVEIDPKTNTVVRRYGPYQGSGAVRAAEGSVWVSAHDVNKVWRLAPVR
jgi:virginiamycin B lyase